jgi:hypothetical protein
MGPRNHFYEMPLPAHDWRSPLEVRFEIDPTFRAAGDQRELGALVEFWRPGVEIGEDSVPIEII